MKKTLTVNLGGTVFQLDEDAYILLDNYLNNLRFHFRNEVGSDEIVRDMEMRISELFTEGLEGGQQVITTDNVEAVIERMGRPEQLDDDNASAYTCDDKASETTFTGDACDEKTRTDAQGGDSMNSGGEKTAFQEIKKRLYRDVDNRILGGVLSGIAVYFGWDATALRLVYILLGFLPGGPSVLLIYLILQFIIPPARTATEKLQMRGEPVNMENIGKTVTGGFEREKGTDAVKKRTGFQKFLDAFVDIVGVLIKIFLIFLFVCCVPFLLLGFFVLFTLIMSFLGVFIHVPSICMDLMPTIPWNSIMDTPLLGIFFLLSVILIIGLPLMVIIQILLQHFGYGKPMRGWAKLSMILAWFVALIVGFVLFFTISTL